MSSNDQQPTEQNLKPYDEHVDEQQDRAEHEGAMPSPKEPGAIEVVFYELGIRFRQCWRLHGIATKEDCLQSPEIGDAKESANKLLRSIARLIQILETSFAGDKLDDLRDIGTRCLNSLDACLCLWGRLFTDEGRPTDATEWSYSVQTLFLEDYLGVAESDLYRIARAVTSDSCAAARWWELGKEIAQLFPGETYALSDDAREIAKSLAVDIEPLFPEHDHENTSSIDTLLPYSFEDYKPWFRLEKGLKPLLARTASLPATTSSTDADKSLAKGADLSRLSAAEQRILAVVRDAGRRLTTNEILAELERRNGAASEGTTKGTLAGLVRRNLLNNRQDVKPKGYGLPEWG